MELVFLAGLLLIYWAIRSFVLLCIRLHREEKQASPGVPEE